MKFEMKKEVENLSSRKLWMIVRNETTLTLINAAKVELQRRNQFNDAKSFSAPH